MVLVLDIENSTILLGAYNKEGLLFKSTLRADLSKTADEYAVSFLSILTLYRHLSTEIEGCIICSVVPALLSTVRQALAHLTCARIYVVGPGIKTGLNIKTDNPAQLGANLVCGAVAVLDKYAAPALLINLDTAVTIVALDANKNLIGASIAPGVLISLEALIARTAQLPQIGLETVPPTVLGTNTVSSMQSGLVYGTSCMIDGMVDKFSALLDTNPILVATGDIAPFILPHCAHTIIEDATLILDGLYLIYEKNIK
ncbi:MAG: type III pantothenate kinase [Oscillospiraceae bacterium]|nr:type III pantothenate kinase [Oscillospiraceae bacterium]